MVTTEEPRERNMDLKYKQVNASQSVTRMTKKDVDIRTDQIGRECLDELSTWRGAVDEQQGVKKGGSCGFDLEDASKSCH